MNRNPTRDLASLARKTVKAILVGGAIFVGGAAFYLAAIVYAIFGNPFASRDNLNPIADRTFSVDYEVVSEGTTVRMSRNYACDDQIATSDDANTYYLQFPSNRIASHRLPSGAGIYIVTPNPCLAIARAEAKGVKCSDGKAYGFVFPYIQTPDCSGRYPIVQGHVPLVFWTPDFDDPHEIYAHATVASLNAPDSHVQKAIATITFANNLTISPPDSEYWIALDIHQKLNTYEPQPTYFGVNRHLADIAACRHRAIGNHLELLRKGGDVLLTSDACFSPIDTHGGYISEMEGILYFKRENKTLEPSHLREERRKLVRNTRKEIGLAAFGIPLSTTTIEKE